MQTDRQTHTHTHTHKRKLPPSIGAESLQTLFAGISITPVKRAVTGGGDSLLASTETPARRTADATEAHSASAAATGAATMPSLITSSRLDGHADGGAGGGGVSRKTATPTASPRSHLLQADFGEAAHNHTRVQTAQQLLSPQSLVASLQKASLRRSKPGQHQQQEQEREREHARHSTPAKGAAGMAQDARRHDERARGGRSVASHTMAAALSEGKLASPGVRHGARSVAVRGAVFATIDTCVALSQEVHICASACVCMFVSLSVCVCVILCVYVSLSLCLCVCLSVGLSQTPSCTGFMCCAMPVCCRM